MQGTGVSESATAGAARGAEERARLVGRAGVVGAGTLASRVLGLVRDMVIAAVFPLGATDAWWVAFTIPNALRSLLGEGAVTSAVVPVLSEKLAKEGDAAARSFFARVRGVSLVALAVVTVLGIVFAEPLTRLFAGGYAPAEFARTVALTRAVFPYIFFMGTAALGMAALNANRRFAVAAFAPALLNVAMVVFALLALYVGGGDRVQWLAWGALVGGLLQVVAQWPALHRIGYGGLPKFALDPDVRKVLRRIAPLTFGIGIYYVDLVIARRFLSELGEGAQSWYSWAMRLCDFPQGIFVMALSTAALPSLSTLAARGERDELAKTWAHGMGLAMFVAIPASAALVAIGEPIVALLWQGGAIWTVAAVRQIVPAFYALGDTRTPVIVSALDLCAFIALAVMLKGPMGHVGVSVAVAGSSAVQMLLLLAGLRWRMGTIRGGDLARSTSRTLLASVAASVAGWGAARVAGGLGAMAAFAAVYLLAAWALRSPELKEIGGALSRKVRPAR